MTYSSFDLIIVRLCDLFASTVSVFCLLKSLSHVLMTFITQTQTCTRALVHSLCSQIVWFGRMSKCVYLTSLLGPSVGP